MRFRSLCLQNGLRLSVTLYINCLLRGYEGFDVGGGGRESLCVRERECV